MEKINNVIKSSTAPEDVHALWLNTDDNSLNAFNFRNGWVSIAGGGEEFPTDYARQGDNPDASLSATQAAVNSLSPIASAAAAYNTGKVELAQNITAKGVPASATETLPELAEKVATITQETYQINGGEMYAKQLFGSLEAPNYWNLYDVLTQLLSDGRLANYGGILLAEYYRGYDSLALSGAGSGGAYVVSDKDGDGNFIMYTADTTHTWTSDYDGKINRWVAYCFYDEWHEFDITNTDTSPRSIYIGKNVGTIKLFATSRTCEIIVPDGNKLQNINLNGYAFNFNNVASIRNIKDIAYKIFNNNSAIQKVYLQADKISSIGAPVWYGAGTDILNNFTLDVKEVLSNDNRKTGVRLFEANRVPLTLTEITIANTESCSGYLSIAENDDRGQEGQILPNFKKINLINVENLRIYLSSYNDARYSALKDVYMSYKTNDKTKGIAIVTPSYYGSPSYMRVDNIELKEGWCKPLTVTFTNGLTEENMYAHILQRLKQDEPDCGDGVTITLGSTNLNKLTSQESQDLLALLRGTYGYTFA